MACSSRGSSYLDVGIIICHCHHVLLRTHLFEKRNPSAEVEKFSIWLSLVQHEQFSIYCPSSFCGSGIDGNWMGHPFLWAGISDNFYSGGNIAIHFDIDTSHAEEV